MRHTQYAEEKYAWQEIAAVFLHLWLDTNATCNSCMIKKPLKIMKKIIRTLEKLVGVIYRYRYISIYVCRGGSLSLPFFFFSAVQSIQNAWSSFLPFLLRIDSRCDKRSRGSSGDQRQSSSFLSSGKPDDLLQSDNVNSYPTTAGIVGV